MDQIMSASLPSQLGAHILEDATESDETDSASVGVVSWSCSPSISSENCKQIARAQPMPHLKLKERSFSPAPKSGQSSPNFRRSRKVPAHLVTPFGSLPDLPGAVHVEQRPMGEIARRPTRLQPLPVKMEDPRHLVCSSIATAPSATRAVDRPFQADHTHDMERFSDPDLVKRNSDVLQIISGRQTRRHDFALYRRGSLEPLPPIQRRAEDNRHFEPVTVPGSEVDIDVGKATRTEGEDDVFAARSSTRLWLSKESHSADEGRENASPAPLSSPMLPNPPCEREPPEGQESDEPSRQVTWPLLVTAQATDRDSCSNRFVETNQVTSSPRRPPTRRQDRVSTAQARLIRPIRAADVRMTAINRFGKPTNRRKRSFQADDVDGPTSRVEDEDEMDDLDWFLPSRTLSIFVGTWNMQGVKVPDSVAQFILPHSIELLQDVYAVCTQESPSSRHSLELKLQETLGPSHILLHSTSLGVIYIVVFVRRELLWFVSDTKDDAFATRAVNMRKTKGGVAVSVKIFGTSLLFITSHLTAHEGNQSERNNDISRITAGLHLSDGQVLSDKAVPLTDRFDFIVWCGDLNYRVDIPYTKAMAKILVNKHLELLEEDQLIKEMAKGGVFEDFEEMDIKFPPTFKFDVGTDDYDTSAKQRTPSWTDRILYCSRPTTAVTGIVYDSCPAMCYSDHKPVLAVLEISIKPSDSSAVQLSQSIGKFERDIYVEGNQRRLKKAASMLSRADTVDNPQSAVCTLL